MSYSLFVHILSIPLDLDQMRMWWIRINSVGKIELLTEEIFSRQFSLALLNSAFLTFTITMKILSSSKMKWKRKEDVKLLIFVRNTAYLISCQEFRFQRRKQVKTWATSIHKLKNSLNLINDGVSVARQKLFLYVMCCAIWYYLYNLKNVKNTHGGVLISVKLQVLACNFTKVNNPPWVFLTFFKLYKWYQIAQRTTYFMCNWQLNVFSNYTIGFKCVKLV